MLSTPHVLIGGAIGKQIERPYIALPVAFASHYVMDAVPHVDTISAFGFSLQSWKLTACDLTVGFALLVLVMYRQRRWIWMLLGAMAAMGPDAAVFLTGACPVLDRLPGATAVVRLHVVTGVSLPNSQWVLGLGTQAVALAVAFILLRRRTHGTG